MVAVGATPRATLQDFAAARGIAASLESREMLRAGDVLVWQPATDSAPVPVRIEAPRSERRRHRRKYAQGELIKGESFYFRGPEGKLNLRAQNLVVFLQMADGVDDETWQFHLGQGDYSRWFRACIKDDSLADAAAAIEADTTLSTAESRARIRQATEERYTLPA